jgi:hypothetical protein
MVLEMSHEHESHFPTTLLYDHAFPVRIGRLRKNYLE